MTRSRHKNAVSSLVGTTLTAESLPTLRIARLSSKLAAQVDAIWPALRVHHAVQHWRWAEIRHEYPDAFALINEEDDSVAGLWAGRFDHAITLQGGRFYRLDFMEAAPNTPGFGQFLWAAIALRAEELKACGIVFGALEEAKAAHIDAGASEAPELPGGWNVERGLLPLAMWRESFAAHLEAGHELQKP